VKVNYLRLLAAATVVLLSTAAARSDESPASTLVADASAAPPAPTTTASTAPGYPRGGSAAADEDIATYYDDSDPVRDFVARAGAWAVQQSGSPTKVDEYQGRTSSPFLNIDGIMSNGERTLDFSATESDNDDQNARLHYYGGPWLEADVFWEQFPHELDSHSYAGWNYLGLNNTAGPMYVMGAGAKGSGPTNPQNPTNVVLFTRNDLAPGQDFAMSVQEFKANFKGHITENLRWRVNVFGIDKEGDRQVNAFQHCSAAAGNGSNLPVALPTGGLAVQPSGTYPAASAANPTPSLGSVAGPPDSNLTSQCHVTSQSQHIDWQTTEATFALELRMGADTTMEYSHLVRAFTANDQAVTYNYDASANFSLNPTAVSSLPFSSSAGHAPKTIAQQNQQAAAIANLTAGYAIVPDSETQIDRLKFSTKIGADTDAYLLGYAGYNEDLLRDTYRDFNGVDLRITNKTFDKLAVTGYAKYYREDSTSPLTALSPYPVNGVPANNFYQEPYLGSGEQIDRETHTFGATARWRPFQGEIDDYRGGLSLVGGYEYSTLLRQNAGDTLLSGGPGQFIDASGFFSQPNSNKNTFSVGVDEKWSQRFDTFLRYKFISTEYPLYGITPDAGQFFAELNSSLPTQENRIELGCTWTPTDSLMVNATLYVENAMSDAPYVGTFTYPGWTSNSLPFTLSAWWAPTSDWSFSVGAAEMDSWINQGVSLTNLGASPGEAVPITPWRFTGTADVLTFGTRYAATRKLSFTGMFEYVRGENFSSAIVNPASQVGNTWLPYTNTPYDIGGYSLVKMQSFRFEAGADYVLRPRVTTYLRYNYYDYQDESGLTSGQANMLLGGMSATF